MLYRRFSGRHARRSSRLGLMICGTPTHARSRLRRELLAAREDNIFENQLAVLFDNHRYK